MSVRRLLLFLALGCSLAHPAFGAARSNEPLKIKSESLRADNEKKTAVFEGKVVARQGDLTLYADRLVISYSKDGDDLSRVEAFGNVRIVQGTREAFGAHAIYDNKAGRIVLEGSPKVMDGANVITGQVITYFVDEQRSEVTGGPGEPVRAEIIPKSKEKDGVKR